MGVSRPLLDSKEQAERQEVALVARGPLLRNRRGVGKGRCGVPSSCDDRSGVPGRVESGVLLGESECPLRGVCPQKGEDSDPLREGG